MSTSTTAIALAQALGPVRRALVKATRAAGDLPDLSEAQIEVLRLLVGHGVLSSTEIATRLGLARPTVSNLLKSMSGLQLIDRTASEGDLRSTLVGASPRARVLLARYDRVSADILDEALGRLDPDTRDALSGCAAALTQLTAALSSVP
ncbi:MAG: MarR family transcriptional regulator [Cellulomonadaceae bacterium]|nr:MarR family transcriptional regulator [Cellulomonadaceae bacterium]